jgi:hypothetical protein
MRFLCFHRKMSILMEHNENRIQTRNSARFVSVFCFLTFHFIKTLLLSCGKRIRIY